MGAERRRPGGLPARHDGRRRVPWRATAALALILAVGACSLVFQRPTVRVARVSLASVGFTGGTVEIGLEVMNPNGFALETRSFRYALSFAELGPGGDTTWVRLVDEERRDTVRLEAGDTTAIPLRLPFDLATLGTAAGRLLREGELGYRFSGALRLQTPVGGVEVPFDERGALRP